MTDDLLAWAENASAVERRHVIVKLRDAPEPLALPKVDRWLSGRDPAGAAGQMNARADAIEARKRQLAPLQAPVMELIRGRGGESSAATGW